MCSPSYLLSYKVEVKRHGKPHTKMQQLCLELSTTLPPLTEHQKAWMRRKTEKIGYYLTRGYRGRKSGVWCQECGQWDEVQMPPLSIDLDADNHHTCSRCGQELNVRKAEWLGYQKHVTHDNHFCVIATCQGMQVCRVFDIHRTCQFGSTTSEEIVEVYQVWFDPDTLKSVVISKSYYRTYYSFRWNLYSPFKVVQRARRSGGYDGDGVYNVGSFHTYPHPQLLPIVRRNGYTAAMLKMNTNVIKVWEMLLTDPGAEALAKMRQYNVLDHWFTIGDRRKDKQLWLKQVKICSRHGYIINDASMWFDYVDLLDYFHKDTHSPKYLCPANLKHEHDRLLEKRNRIEKAKEIENLIKKSGRYEEQYRKARQQFFGVEISNGRITINVLGSVMDFVQEYLEMHHCVFANEYYNMKKHPSSLILSAKDSDGNRLETIEVSIKTWSIVQCRGKYNNPTKYHNQIIKLLESHMHQLKKIA